MRCCTFFGHADASEEIALILKSEIIELINKQNINFFYVGNNGNFDKIVQNVLFELLNEYKIKCYIVLAYLPDSQEKYALPTLFPEGIENVPKKFAISYRNKWMIEKSDYVVAYIMRTFGGAYKFKTMAEKKGKRIINISL